MRNRRRYRRLAALAAGVALAGAVLLGTAHTPPGRALAWSWLQRFLRGYGIDARAASFDYNLLTLDIRVRGVALSVPGQPDAPFFSADLVRVTLPARILLGRWAAESVEIDSPRVRLQRTADGATNWPDLAGGAPAGGPLALDLGTVRVRRLDLAASDARTDQSLNVRSVSVELPAPASGSFGALTLDGRATFQRGDRAIVVQSLNGGIRFDGMNLWLRDLRLETTTDSLQLDGRLGPVFDSPALALTYRGAVDLATASRWIDIPGEPVGVASVEGSLTGPATQPEVALSAAVDRLAWAGLRDLSLQSTAAWRPGVLEVSALTLRLAGGELTGTARVALGGQLRPGALSATWRQLPLATLATAASFELPVKLSASTEGRIDARWTEPRIDALTLAVDTRSRGVARAGRLAIDGSAALSVNDTRWQMRVDSLVGRAVRVVGSAGGQVSPDDLRRSTLSGSVAAGVSDLSSARDLVRTVTGAGPDMPFAWTGEAAADLSLGGSLASPQVRATLGGTQVRYGAFGPFSVRAHATSAGGRMDIDSIEVQSNGNLVQGTGRVTFANRAIEGRLEARLTDLASLWPGFPDALRVSGSAAATADVSGTWSAPLVRLNATGPSLAFAGQAADRWSASLRVDPDGLAVDELELSQSAGRLSIAGRYKPARGSYALTVAGRSWKLQPVHGGLAGPAIPLQGIVDVEFDGTGSLNDLGGRGRLSASSLSWSGHDIGDLDAGFTLAGQSLQTTARAVGQPIVANGTFGIAPPGPFSLDAAIDHLDLASLAARWLRAAVPWTGSLSAGVRAGGDLRDLRSMSVDVDLGQLEGSFDSTPIRLVRPARLSYADQLIEVGDAEWRSGDTVLQVRGRMGRESPEALVATLDGRLRDFSFIPALVAPFAGTAVPPLTADGSVKATLNARGEPTRPTIEGEVVVRDASVQVGDMPAATGIALDARYRDDGLEIEQVVGMWQGATIAAAGHVPAALIQPSGRAPGSADVERARLSVRVDSATEALLAPWLDQETIDRVRVDAAGSMTIDADALSLRSVRGEVVLQRAQTTIAGVALSQTRPTHLAIADGRVRIAEWEWAGPGSQIVLRGEAGIGPRPELDVTTDGHLDLALLSLFSPDVATAGQARLTLRVHGSPAQPELDGRVEVSGAELRMADPRLIVTGLAGTLTFAGNRLAADNLEGTANGGSLRLSGSFGYRDVRELAGSLTVEGRGMAFDVRGLRAEVDADLALATRDARPALSGLITVRRGAYREPFSITGGLFAALRQQGVAATAAARSVTDAIELNVRVVSADDIVVDNNYGQLQLGADVRLVGTPLGPGLVGRATVHEGGQIFLGGNTYRVVGEGTIDFADANRIVPTLSIAAATRVSGHDVTLNLTGTPETLRTDLSSDPPLGQADLISLLLTGRTIEEAGGGALAIPPEQMLGYLSGEFLGTAGRAVGLDVIRIQRGLPDVQFNAGLVATETDPGSRLTFAKNVTPDLQLIFSESLKQTGGLTWIVGYKLRGNIEVRAVSLDNRNRSYDFRHDVSFGGPTAPAARVGPPREPVLAVQFTGVAADRAADLSRRLKLKRGDRFDFFKWQRDRDRLEKYFYERGYYEARVSATRRTVVEGGAPGVALEYDVLRGPSTTLAVQGYELPSAVMRELQETWARITFDRFLIDEIVSRAQAHLRERGYLRAAATGAIEGDAEEKRFLLRLDPGPRTTGRDIQLSGNDRITTRSLRSFIDARRLSDVAWIDPGRLRTELLSLYRDQGMLAASVRVEPAMFQADSAVLPVTIVEGPEFRIANVTIEGVRGLAEGTVRSAFLLAAGDRYGPADLERARQRLETRYRQEGFAEVRVAMATDVHRDTAGVDVSVKVGEGPRRVLRDVVVTGAMHTNPTLVSRTLDLDVGAPVDLAAWYLARSRLYDTGVFRRVDIEEQPIDDGRTAGPGAVEQPVRARVTLEEWPPLRARYGLQLSDEVKPASDTRELTLGVSGDLTYRNLLGRALSTGLATRYDANMRAARAFVTAPALAGRPITSNFFIARSREELGQASARPFVTDKIDLTGEQRVRPWRRVEMAYSYNYQRNHTFDFRPDPGVLIPFDITVNVARLTGTMLFDSRNDLVDATRGWFHSSNIEYAAPELGSDVHFMKYVLQQYYYRELPGGVVLASAGRLGLAAAFGQQLIPSERFFAGGGTSVRGFAQDALGPIDVFGDVAGGNALMIFNQEVRFPVFKWFRGVGFLDAGNVFASPGELSLGALRPSLGLGTRIQTPVALVRIDLGVPLSRRAGESRARWIFSIGQVF